MPGGGDGIDRHRLRGGEDGEQARTHTPRRFRRKPHRSGHLRAAADHGVPATVFVVVQSWPRETVEPQSGIVLEALGIDRVVMLFAGLDNIRDCIAFPKTQKASDMMTEAPSSVEAKQLKELNIRVVPLSAK